MLTGGRTCRTKGTTNPNVDAIEGTVYPVDSFGAEQARRYREAMENFEAALGTEFTKGHNFKPHLLYG
jgi:hypothetical protein